MISKLLGLAIIIAICIFTFSTEIYTGTWQYWAASGGIILSFWLIIAGD